MSINPHIRHFVRRDLFAVLQIEQENSLAPWGEKHFVRFFSKHGGKGYVAEYREQIIGFMLLQDVDHEGIELNLVELSVRKDCQRRGVGESLLECALGFAISEDFDHVSYYAAESNLNAQLFLRSQEFKAVEVHRSFFANGEDAYEMVTDTSFESKPANAVLQHSQGE